APSAAFYATGTPPAGYSNPASVHLAQLLGPSIHLNNSQPLISGTHPTTGLPLVTPLTSRIPLNITKYAHDFEYAPANWSAILTNPNPNLLNGAGITGFTQNHRGNVMLSGYHQPQVNIQPQYIAAHPQYANISFH